MKEKGTFTVKLSLALDNHGKAINQELQVSNHELNNMDLSSAHLMSERINHFIGAFLIEAKEELEK